jgi:hypothetical protein
MKKRERPDELRDKDGDVLHGSASFIGVKQHCCRDYWDDEPQHTLALCVGEQCAVLDVHHEDAQLPVPMVLHEHDQERSRSALDLTCFESRRR